MKLRPFDPRHSALCPHVDIRPEHESPFARISDPTPILETLRQARQEQSLSFDDLLPYRTLAAWRIVRRLGSWQGAFAPEESLIDALAPSATNPDPWYLSEALSGSTSGRSAEAAYIQARQHLIPPQVIRCHLDASNLRPGFQPTIHNIPIRSIPLLPPPIPTSCLPVETYNPNSDPLLKNYILCIRAAAQDIDIISGSAEHPFMGKWGLAGLFDPWYIRQVFPSRFQLVAVEQALVEETLSYLVTAPKQLGAENILRSQYGFDRTEIISLIRLAKHEAYVRTQGDLEHERAMMILRLEDFCRRCQESLDLRSELMAMKHMAVVLGLSKAETGDMMSDMAEVVKVVSQERSRPLLEEGT